MSARFGLIVSLDVLQAWQFACVDALANESVQCEAIIRLDGSVFGNRGRLAAASAPRGFGRREVPSSERPARTALPAAAEIRCTAGGSKGSLEIDDADIARIGSYGLDFALDFTQWPCARRLAPAMRYGVWSFQFGDPPRSFAWRPGSWELLHGEPVVRAALVKCEAAGDSILKEGYVETTLDDAAATADAVRLAAAAWPAQVWREIDAGEIRGEGLPHRDAASVADAPTRIQEIALAARVAAAYAGRRIGDALGEEHWYPGLVRRPIASFLQREDYRVEWLPRSRAGRYAADPFGCAADGTAYVFCEEYDFRDKRGFLSVATLPDPGEPFAFTPVMRADHHLSYPYILEHDGAVYCLPEASQSGEVALFRARRFPFEWEKVAVLLAEFGGVDSTIVKHDGRWWMFCTSREAANRDLYVWFSDELEGPWSGHARNPVKCDVRSSRSAGTPFVQNGILYRPAQDCAGSYGRRVVINAVRELTPTRFKEEPVALVAPDRSGPNPNGLHTLSALGSWTLIDGKCRRFVLTEFIRRWNRLLRLAFGGAATHP